MLTQSTKISPRNFQRLSYLVKVELFNRIVTKLFEENIGNVAILILSYIKPVSGMFH